MWPILHWPAGLFLVGPRRDPVVWLKWMPAFAGMTCPPVRQGRLAAAAVGRNRVGGSRLGSVRDLRHQGRPSPSGGGTFAHPGGDLRPSRGDLRPSGGGTFAHPGETFAHPGETFAHPGVGPSPIQGGPSPIQGRPSPIRGWDLRPSRGDLRPSGGGTFAHPGGTFAHPGLAQSPSLERAQDWRSF